ncbi:MAG: hypothetical protein ACERKK_02275 [Poseidonibacter sp.]|uniref:hypothetical protein n=1 Tax=Poseidonibacter sp. TaxID=2321188 RepID=UPI00359E6BA9
MQKIALVLFVAAELCYYLLIAQTGIVEYFSSDLFTIIYLPIGGVIGSLLSSYIKTSNQNKIFGFLLIQLAMSFFYPNLSSLMLFILGISVGALAPLLINELKKGSSIQLGFALAIAYVLGTFLFNFDVALRGNIAIALTVLAIVSLFFIKENKSINISNSNFALASMLLWIFLDSSLFETLSRDENISIWRDGYTYEIAFFHLLGIVLAFKLQLQKNLKELFIIILFALCYFFYFLNEALILSIVYPIVISYYNVVILQTLIHKNIKTLSIYMVFIGWFASGAGLFIALEHLILFVPIIFIIFLIITINQNFIPNKEKKYA